MKLAKALANLLALLAVAFCLGSVANAQAAPAADKPAQKSPKKSRAKKAPAQAAPAAQPAAPAAAADAGSADKLEAVANKRDPFVPLVSTKKEQEYAHLPPGKAGLVISTVRIDGAIRSPGGMIAVVTNPEQRVYFIREGDRLYDGAVEKIGLDGVTFRESSKDAFGKPVERSVTKRIYPSAGEQQ
jgi:Tfp pilus assembly protein PilP